MNENITDLVKLVIELCVVSAIILIIFTTTGSFLRSRISAVEEIIIVTESTHERKPIDNPNAFDPRCFVDEEDYLESSADCWVKGARDFYEKTGVQLRRIHLDIENIESVTTLNSAVDYCYKYIEENIVDKDYSVIVFSTSAKEISNNESSSDFVEVDEQFFYGNKTTEFFDAEGAKILEEHFDFYIDDYRSDNTNLAMEKASDALMGYKDYGHIVLKVIMVIVVIAFIITMVVIVYRLREKKREEDLRILNTPIESLTEKYLNGDEI